MDHRIILILEQQERIEKKIDRLTAMFKVHAVEAIDNPPETAQQGDPTP